MTKLAEQNYHIIIHGTGGHGSRPDLVHNPVDCFAAVYGAISNMTKARDSATTFTVLGVNGGKKSNVIGENLRFTGTLHYAEAQDAHTFRRRLGEILEEVCPAYHCRGEITEPEL